MMTYITLSEFKARFLITGTTYDVLIQSLIDDYSGVVDSELCHDLFNVTAVNSTTVDDIETIRFYAQPSRLGSDFIKIGAWQRDNLVVKEGSFGDAFDTVTTLTLNEDYSLVYVLDNPSNPVWGVQLEHRKYDGQFLQIEGFRGYSSTIPTDLKGAMLKSVMLGLKYSIRQSQFISSDGSGGGAITSEKDLTTSINYHIDTESERYAEALAGGDFTALPTNRSILGFYKNFCEKETFVST